MTPAQKAKYLFEVSRWKLMGLDSTDAMKDAVAQDIALFVVEEIRDSLPQISDIQYYWIDVKLEIKKL